MGNENAPKIYPWLHFLNPFLPEFCICFRITQYCDLNVIIAYLSSWTQLAQNFINAILKHFDFADIAGSRSSLRL